MELHIKEEIDIVESNKFYNLMALMDYIDFDPETKTITFKGDIKFKVEGNYNLETDKHINLTSNKKEWDSELDIPYSVMINCDEKVGD